MNKHSPQDQVPNHLLRSIFDLPDVSEHKDVAIAAAQLDPESLRDVGSAIPRGAENTVLEFLATHLGRPYAGAEFGIALDPRNSSLLTYILFNSTTLHHALHHVQRFMPVSRPQALIDIRETQDHVDVVIDGIGTHLMLNTHLIEFSLGTLLGALRVATGVDRLATQVGISGARLHGAKELAAVYGCHVSLEEDANYLRFPKSVLALSIRDADAHLLRHLTSYGEVLLSRNPRAVSRLTDKVGRHVLHGMASGRPSMAETATALGLSERTLTRRLLEEGTSFRAIVSDAQLKLAQAFLSDPHLSLAETAHLCGFSDQSSFTQAYRRWTGRTPKADRMLLIK